MSIHMSSISLNIQGCRCSGGDETSELSSPRKFEEAGSEECHSGRDVRVVVSEINIRW